ncbi:MULTISPECIES: RNA polymerase sigma factor [unclassified Mesorhizobium]|uniref:RNA polymerase sigma factor n=1 Tax=unclassified Mesorhizobium TaxID=325217 RepID=UPI003014BB98
MGSDIGRAVKQPALETDGRAAAEAAARRSYGKLVAILASRSGDVAGAEDALADAFAAALEQWPASGVPANPEGWLMAVARRRGVDAIRRRRTSAEGAAHLQLIAAEIEASSMEDDLPDERLRLMFACAHPAVEPSIRAPLILQTILGFDAAAIASAFLVSPATMGQRLVRAKNRIREAGIPFSIPERDALDERLDAVLEAIYAAFAEGWADPTGAESRRRNLATEGIWLGRLTASLMPDEPETLGLLALMLFAEARRAARRNENGDYVPLAEQDTKLWDSGLIDEAETLLRRAGAMGKIGRYQLEAAVQSAHVARRLTGETDWQAIARFYEALSRMTQSPVVSINHAVALAHAGDTGSGLTLLEALADDKRLLTYQPYWAARAELLTLAQKPSEAHEAYGMAIGLETDPAIRKFLQDRRARLRN